MGGEVAAAAERYRERLAGVLSCYDRIIVTGTLPGACYAKGMMGFLSARQIRVFGYPHLPNRFVIACATALPNWPVRLASPSNTLPRSTFARKTSSPRSLPCAATIPAWSISSRRWKPATPTSPGRARVGESGPIANRRRQAARLGALYRLLRGRPRRDRAVACRGASRLRAAIISSFHRGSVLGSEIHRSVQTEQEG